MRSGKFYWDLKIEETKAFFNNRPGWMSVYDNDFPSAAFIKGLINEYKPENLFEAGTAAGWAAYYMLEEAHKYKDNAVLTSVDFADRVYYDAEKQIGAAFYEKAPELRKFWDLKTNLLVADYVSGCDKKFDFVFIDASHLHPWAALDLLAILPCLEKNAVIVLHDVFLNKIAAGKMSAGRHPEQVVCGKEKYFGPNRIYEVFEDKMTLSYDDVAPNCAAIELEQLSFDKISEALDSPWEPEILNYTSHENFIEIFNKIKTGIELFAGKKQSDTFLAIANNRLAQVERKVAERMQNAADFINKTSKNKKTIFWGASKFLGSILEQNRLETADVLGIVDKNPALQGKKICGLTVFSPKMLSELKPQQIFSTVVTTPDMKSKIINILQNEGIFEDFEIIDDLFECFQNFED